MINFIRITSFLVAIVILLSSVFYIDAEQELAQAQQAFNQGDMDQTLRLARRANFASSDNNIKISAYYLQAKAAAKMQQTNTGKAYLDQLLSLDPNNIKAILFRGKLQLQLGDHQNAITDLNKGLTLASGKFHRKTIAYYHTQRGYAYLGLKLLTEAKKDAHTAIKSSLKLPEAHDLLSKVLEKKGDIKGALDECELAYNLSIERHKTFFMTPEGRKLSDRLVNLKVKYLMAK